MAPSKKTSSTPKANATKRPTKIVKVSKANTTRKNTTPKITATLKATKSTTKTNTQTKSAAATKTHKAQEVMNGNDNQNDPDVPTDDKVSVVQKTANNNDMVNAKLNAFAKARGLNFEELYVEDSAPTSLSTKDAAANSTTKAVTIDEPRASTDSSSPPVQKPKLKLTVKKPVEKTVEKTVAKASKKTTEKPVEKQKIRFLTRKRSAENVSDDAAAALIQITAIALEGSPPPAKKPKRTAATKQSKRTVTPKRRAAKDVPSDAEPTEELEDAPESSPPPTKRARLTITTKDGKVKKAPTNDLPPGYDGNATGKGSSCERPVGEKYLAEPWRCGNIMCNTGFTWLPRGKDGPVDDVNSFGRKVISNFFGRNKQETRRIHPEVWHFFCRRDYQRFLYDAVSDQAKDKSPKAVSILLANTIRDQLIRLQLWRPNALFTIQLNVGTQRRLNAYLALLQRHNNDQNEAMAALPAPRTIGKKDKVVVEEAFPAYLSIDFKNLHAGQNKSYADIEAMLVWAEQQIDNKLSEHIPPFELLLNEVQDGEIVNDPDNNYFEWLAHKTGVAADLAASATKTPATSISASHATPIPASPENPANASPATLQITDSTARFETPNSTPPSSVGSDGDRTILQDPPTPTPASRTAKPRLYSDLPAYVPGKAGAPERNEGLEWLSEVHGIELSRIRAREAEKKATYKYGGTNTDDKSAVTGESDIVDTAMAYEVDDVVPSIEKVE